MPATFDLTRVLPGNGYREMGPNSVTFRQRVNFALKALTAGQTGKIGVLPAGFVLTERWAFVRTPQGAVGTFNIGTSADSDGILVGCNANLAAGSNAGGTVGAFAAGTLFTTDTELWIEFASGALSVAAVDIALRGFMLPRA